MLDVKLDHCVHKNNTYTGPCDVYGRREGIGTEYWRNKDQKFVGKFLRDTFHGEGCYQWLDRKQKVVYEGNFYSNFKEGYGLASLSDGTCFEGLFCNNRPFGPGVQTYVNGRQDVGFWCGRRIVRLSRSVDYIIPRLASTSAGKLKLLQFQTILPYVEERCDVASALGKKHDFDPCLSNRLYSSFIHDPRSLFFQKIAFDKAYFVKVPRYEIAVSEQQTSFRGIDYDSELGEASVTARPIPPHCLCPVDEFEMEYKTGNDSVSICASYGDLEPEGGSPLGILQYYTRYQTLDGVLPRFAGEESPSDTTVSEMPGEKEEEEGQPETMNLISWNRSELCMEMLKQIFRFRSFEKDLSYNISDLMSGARAKFRKTGEKEKTCIHFLKMCSIGPAYIVKDFLCTNEISESIMDARGNNSVMFACASDQHDVIKILLNYGADVNSFNDENLTPLNLCLLRRLAESESLRNWEIAFLPPEAKPLEAFEKTAWQTDQSVKSLDRIFGDGMSIYESKNSMSDPKAMGPDSAFCFEGEDHSVNVSTVTVMDYLRDYEMPKIGGSEFGTGNLTMRILERFVPGSYKREEFLKSVAAPTSKDRYFFDLAPESTKSERGSDVKKKSGSGLESLRDDMSLFDPTEKRSNISEKIAKIDRTIELLLIRGADPNLADAPKPSLHLAVYSKESSLVKLLLSYGAAPDSQSLPQEGLLTPLHVTVLMTPSQQQVEICELLLNYGASPEEETSPDFNPNDEDPSNLDPVHGRTPLQLLCCRKDAECTDYKMFLTQIALILAGVSKRNHFFKGHTYLSLTIIYKNYSLMEALLRSNRVDPNQILGENLGTALHVLVSTAVQKTTSYEDSIHMCDLLLQSGANPNLQFKGPPSLKGTCVDFGYREIEEERTRRREKGLQYSESKKLEKRRKSEVESGSTAKVQDSKKGTKEESKKKMDVVTSDYLSNHERVVQYLESKAREPRRDRMKRSEEKVLKSRDKSEVKEEKAKDVRKKGEVESGKKSESHSERQVESGSRKEKNAKGGGSKKDEKEDEMVLWLNRNVKKGKHGKSSEDGKGSKGLKTVKQDEKSTRKISSPSEVKLKGKLSSVRKQVTRGDISDRLPERFRRSLIQIFGKNLGSIDLNELLLPYVVLRNGDLYYKFKGQKTSALEQYSLI